MDSRHELDQLTKLSKTKPKKAKHKPLWQCLECGAKFTRTQSKCPKCKSTDIDINV